jgi:hypothetical protein
VIKTLNIIFHLGTAELVGNILILTSKDLLVYPIHVKKMKFFKKMENARHA